MLRSRPLVLILLLVAATALPALGGGGPSLRGALRALERRRRSPQGSTYPLASFQYPEKVLEYLASRNDYQSDDAPILLDNLERDKPLGKAVFLGYLDKDEEYPSDDLGVNYKRTAFRERSGENKARRKKFIEKKRSSAFRERGTKQSVQADRLKELFLNELAEEEDKQREEAQLENDAEYVELLKELWDKYKNYHPENEIDETPQDLVRLYKERSIKKRQIPREYSLDGWRPSGYKKKRSSNQRLDDADTPNDFLYSLKFVSQGDPSTVENLKDEKINDEDEDPDVSKIMAQQESRYPSFDPETPNLSDIRDEYMLALQPLNNLQSGDEPSNEEESEFMYENEKEKRFPVTKRSSSFSMPLSNIKNRRDLVKRNLRNDKSKMLRSAGTDPKVIKELSSLFGEMDDGSHNSISKPVKRSSNPDETSHEIKPPTAVSSVNHEANNSHQNHSHEHEHDHNHSDLEHNHPHSRHEHDTKPPLLINPDSSLDRSHEHQDNNKEDNSKDEQKSQLNMDHPIILKKKSIDWSNYFGMDKRKKKSYDSNLDMSSLRNLYLGNAKRNMNQYSPESVQLLDQPIEDPINIFNNKDNFEIKRKPMQIDPLKLESMDNKLKTLESAILDEALPYSAPEEMLDTKEEQYLKEKALARLAAEYSLKKMRKALKEIKMSIQSQRNAMKEKSFAEFDEDKEKRMPNKEEKKKNAPDTSVNPKPDTETNGLRDKVEMDFESEQGAGHFLNGPIEPMSEGYMGGSGMRNKPNHIDSYENGQCPLLDDIIRRCHSIDILAGDHGQLFLPLCSLHHICYLCGSSSPTGCDLIFLSEADSVCGGRSACHQAARTALMALREEHDSLADDFEGECERDSCLYRAIESNSGWQHPFKR